MQGREQLICWIRLLITPVSSSRVKSWNVFQKSDKEKGMSMTADELGTCLPHKGKILIRTKKKTYGNRIDWDGLSCFQWLLREPWYSVMYGTWPKGMKICPDTPVTKQHVIFYVLLLTDLDPQNVIAGARSSNPYPEVRNLCSLVGSQKSRNAMKTSLCVDMMDWGKHSCQESRLQGVFLNPSSLLMPGWNPFSLRQLAWLLGTLLPHSAF